MMQTSGAFAHQGSARVCGLDSVRTAGLRSGVGVSF